MSQHIAELVKTADEAEAVIEALKQKFGFHGIVWGDKAIANVLDEENAEHGADYPLEDYPRIIEAVKSSEEWKANSTFTYDASEIWIHISPVIRREALKITGSQPTH